ncbi:MAG: hypothetical protein L6R41_004276 [Letrouitia leprolyta]|nr:MAG: hypothetical protein L6R41_004276 [Letrouitia leprolyta]
MRSLAFWVFCLFGSKVVSATGCNADKYVPSSSSYQRSRLTIVIQLPPSSLPNAESSGVLLRCGLLRNLYQDCQHPNHWIPKQSLRRVWYSAGTLQLGLFLQAYTGFNGNDFDDVSVFEMLPHKYSLRDHCVWESRADFECHRSTSTSRTTPSPTSTSTSTTSSSTTTSSTTTTTSPACTATRAFGDVVRNGGFECGLAPWISQSLPGNSYTITSPGDASTFAYEFDQTGPVSPSTNQNPAFLTQDIGAVNGVPYNLRFRTYFDKCTGDEGFIGVKINNQPVYTVDACDGPAATFNDNLVQFFAPADGSTNVRFEFLIGTTPAVVKIDNVSAIPLH